VCVLHTNNCVLAFKWIQVCDFLLTKVIFISCTEPVPWKKKSFCVHAFSIFVVWFSIICCLRKMCDRYEWCETEKKMVVVACQNYTMKSRPPLIFCSRCWRKNGAVTRLEPLIMSWWLVLLFESIFFHFQWLKPILKPNNMNSAHQCDVFFFDFFFLFKSVSYACARTMSADTHTHVNQEYYVFVSFACRHTASNREGKPPYELTRKNVFFAH